MAKPLPSREYLLKTVDYDPETGVVVWRWRDDVSEPINARDAGTRAGTPHGKFGRAIHFSVTKGKCVRYLEHRVIWKLVYGTDPPSFIDHKNGDPQDNRLTNLRLATHAQNMQNMKGHRNGLKGVIFHKPTGRWTARLMVNGKRISLRYHDTEEQAHAAWVAAARLHHGEFARVA